MALADYDSYDSLNSYDDGYDYNYDYDFATPTCGLRGQLRYRRDARPYGGLPSTRSPRCFEADGVAAASRARAMFVPRALHPRGGSQGQIPAGLYYLEGSNEKLSHYYVFDGDDGRYSLDDSVQYFGNYFVDLDEGDLIVFDPGDEATMYPAPSTSTNPTAPYTNGCYRVGIDIPAGSYTITAATVGEGETDEDSAAFVMKNLDFDDDSIVDTRYVIPGGEQTVTVSNGQYP